MLGWVNSCWSLCRNRLIRIFLMRQFMMGLLDELLDAAGLMEPVSFIFGK